MIMMDRGRTLTFQGESLENFARADKFGRTRRLTPPGSGFDTATSRKTSAFPNGSAQKSTQP
jgi:hypothetical protein